MAGTLNSHALPQGVYYIADNRENLVVTGTEETIWDDYFERLRFERSMKEMQRLRAEIAKLCVHTKNDVVRPPAKQNRPAPDPRRNERRPRMRRPHQRGQSCR